MNMFGRQGQGASESLNQILEDIQARREKQLVNRASEVEVRAGELKYGVDELAKQEWVKSLCALLKATNEVVMCSKPFSNGGYPNTGKCFFVATGDGVRIGFEKHEWPFPTSHHHFEWPDLGQGELLRQVQRVPTDSGLPEVARLTIRHRAPSSLMGLRKFDYRYAADAGITAAEIEENLVKAVAAFRERHAE